MRRHLEDPTIGLAALHGDVVQGRQKILETIQGGVTGLREENRELRRRQEKMLADLGETRDEIRTLRLEMAQALHTPTPQTDLDATPLAGLETPAVATQLPGDSGDENPTGTDPHSTDFTKTSRQGGPPAGSAGSDDHEEGQMDQAAAGLDEGSAQDSEPHDEEELKGRIEAAYRWAAAPARQASPGPAPAFNSSAPPAVPSGGVSMRSEEVAHGVLLMKAAGVASAELVLHRDTWEFLASLAVDHPHFRTPPAVEDVKEGRVQAALSGRSLIAVLIALWETRAKAPVLQADWALATTVYGRVASELGGVTSSGRTIRIVLDDGINQAPPVPDEQEKSQESP